MTTVIFCGTVVSAQLRSWKKLSDLSNFVVFHSVVADLMNGIGHLVRLWILHGPVALTSFNEVACPLVWVMTLSTYGWCSWSAFFIAYERFESVTRPFSRKLTLRRSWIVAVTIWVGNILIAAICLTGIIKKSGLLRLPDNKTALCLVFHDRVWDEREEAYSVSYYTVIAFIPLILAAYFFTRVLVAAWRILRADSETFLGIQAAQRRHVSRLLSSKGFRCIMAIIACHVLLALPFHIATVTLVIGGFPGPKAMREFKVMYSAIFVVNSILYVCWVESLRCQLARLLCCRRYLPRELPSWVTSSIGSVRRRNQTTAA